MEGGSVYVRERGKLRRVGDTALAPAAPPADGRTESRAPTNKNGRITSRAEGSLRFSESLFQMTLSFVVDNIQHVDSLVGFPEQIGRTVFSAAAEGHVFSGPDASKALRLFADAYGETLLGSLCLRNRFPLLHERMEEIRTFCSLKSLDLFGCRLGDQHELFQHVTSLANLVRLFIGANGLSDAGLQRLTAAVRMRQAGLDSLQVLDVSYNPISERALRYLTCLPELSALDVSQTGMRISPGLQKSMWGLLGLLHCPEPLDVFHHSGCETDGWAEQVVNQWESIGLKTPTQKKVGDSRMSALGFCKSGAFWVVLLYVFVFSQRLFVTDGRQKRIRDVLSSSGPVHGSEQDTSREELHFYRPTAGVQEPPSSTVNPRLEEGKRKLDPERGVSHQSPPRKRGVSHQSPPRKRGVSHQSPPRKRGVSHQSPPRKRGVSSALTAEDMDLLSSY
ncbi:leucine-rich repeat-containing protein 42 isoform X2 [Oryzias latipes]|uniref:leucine-rich repeat-containing protein 42 isoform X2 n=1 Tax=Oryzias latipes TaxID=8090 RepID=UPI0005CC5F5E|nr:leucine-rich repeat-containing protein 42 isoform X2 [Oryzias latipes]